MLSISESLCASGRRCRGAAAARGIFPVQVHYFGKQKYHKNVAAKIKSYLFAQFCTACIFCGDVHGKFCFGIFDKYL